MLEGLMQSYLDAFGKGWAPRDTFPARKNDLRSGKVRRMQHATTPEITHRQSRPHRARSLRGNGAIPDG